jgi:uncharacterized protein involved in cysteine biosynthesis
VINSVGTLCLGLALFIPSLGLTAGALWLAARIAPWFLRQNFEPPTVRSFLFEFVAEAELTQARMTTMMLAAAIVLAVLTPVVCVIRFGGFAL